MQRRSRIPHEPSLWRISVSRRGKLVPALTGLGSRMAGTPEFSNLTGDSIVRFGPFELDLRAAELRKHGTRIRLQDQPFQILRMLVERQGQVVARKEIQQRLWPNDTIVEFDHSINAAIRRLRDALHDSAGEPRYIETVARRGYRFIGQVDSSGQTAALASSASVEPGNGSVYQTATPVPARSFPDRINRRSLVIVAAVTMLLGVWIGADYHKRGALSYTPKLQPLVRLDVELGSPSPGSHRGADAILSPNGTRLVYVSKSKLFTRQLDQASITELPGTERAEGPFLSPDGQWIAFFADGKLKKVSVQGGPVVSLCDNPGVGGGSWGDDGNVVTTIDFRLSRIPSAGGRPITLAGLAPGESAHRWPQILPGGKAVLFTVYRSMTGIEGATIEALSLKDGRRRTVVGSASWGRYLDSGHLIYIDKGTLFAVLFDLDRLQVRGSPTSVLQEVAFSTAWGYPQLDVSRTGTLVYRSSRAGDGLVTVNWLDEAGRMTPLLPVPGNYSSLTLSPDGRRLALISAGDIWVYELGRESMTRLTFGGGYSFPVWTADGRYLAFRGPRGMLWTRSDGTGQPQVLTQSGNPQNPQSFSPDGKQLAFVEISPTTGADIWTLPVESGPSGLRTGKPEVFLQTPFHERGPVFSLDGRWLAYFSNESGNYRVYVDSFPHKGRKRQVSPDGNSGPMWSRNGKDLFFVHFRAPTELMAVSYQSRGDAFVTDQPRVWSNKIARFTATKSYEPGPDGKRIVVLMTADTPQEPQDRLIFLLNFFDELHRRVP
jgi:Tol biopolymer transport system component/DNA-binding winged helix-turn-helix (wHTH) protein